MENRDTNTQSYPQESVAEHQPATHNSPMHVLIAADSFKDALGADAVCAAIAAGLRQRAPYRNLTTTEFPLADGGEGMLAVLGRHLDLALVRVETVDPLLRPLVAPIGISADGQTAFIESAKACGLGLLIRDERNPLLASTFGLGLLLAHAYGLGVTRIVLGIGGTATNDGGMGMACALGWRFLDSEGAPLEPSGRALARLARIVPPASARSAIQVDVLCDVTNPLYGPTGAAHVYAAQKGASSVDIVQLDFGLRQLARCAANQLTNHFDPDTSGAGAAGGLGYGARLFLGGRLLSGTETMLELTQFDSALAHADILITGEGHLDVQTLHGKLIHGLAARAAQRGIPTIALCGQISATREQLQSLGVVAYCIDESAASLADKLARTAENLTATAKKIFPP